MLQKFLKYDTKTRHWVIDLKLFNFKLKSFSIPNVFKYKIQGLNNKIILIDEFDRQSNCSKKIKGLNITIIGSNNNVQIAKDCKFRNSNIIIEANNCNIKIGNKCAIWNLNIVALFGNNQSLEIGNNVRCIGAHIHLKDEQSKVTIGANTLMSHDIHIGATDGHALIDNVNNKCLNIPKTGIEIGSNCWIGFGATITKNCSLQNNTVVGACSVVSKKYDEPNILLAGNPAKIVKHNISWDMRPPHAYVAEAENNIREGLT